MTAPSINILLFALLTAATNFRSLGGVGEFENNGTQIGGKAKITTATHKQTVPDSEASTSSTKRLRDFDLNKAAADDVDEEATDDFIKQFFAEDYNGREEHIQLVNKAIQRFTQRHKETKKHVAEVLLEVQGCSTNEKMTTRASTKRQKCSEKIVDIGMDVDTALLGIELSILPFSTMAINFEDRNCVEFLKNNAKIFACSLITSPPIPEEMIRHFEIMQNVLLANKEIDLATIQVMQRKISGFLRNSFQPSNNQLDNINFYIHFYSQLLSLIPEYFDQEMMKIKASEEFLKLCERIVKFPAILRGEFQTFRDIAIDEGIDGMKKAIC
uniref:Secreted protein n=1 Tax=Globodera pallida TaxID=36090 RepID=A0A183C9E5_GLOPA